MKSEIDLQQEGQRRMKEIVMAMNGLSEEGFINKMHNDPFFHKGFKVLINLFVEAKFKGSTSWNCSRCEDSGKLVRYGNPDLGEPHLVYSDCTCKGENK